jgi:hypothetical protein
MKETTIRPFLPMLERFEGFFREELSSRLSKETLESVMKKAIDDFRHVSAIIPDVPATSPWVKNIIGIAYEIGLWKELSSRGVEFDGTFHCYAESIGKAYVIKCPSGENTGNTRYVMFARLCAAYRFRFSCFFGGRLAVRLRDAG